MECSIHLIIDGFGIIRQFICFDAIQGRGGGIRIAGLEAGIRVNQHLIAAAGGFRRALRAVGSRAVQFI